MGFLELPELESELFFLRRRTKLPSYSGIYVFYSIEGYAIYIGKSENISERNKQHYNEVKKFAIAMECFRIDNETDRDIYETYLINKWQPVLNDRKVFEFKIMNKQIVGEFETITELIEKYKHVRNFGKTRRITLECQGIDMSVSINEENVCECIDEIFGYKKSMMKSDVRWALRKYGYHIDDIMSKDDFHNLLTRNGYDTRVQCVKNRRILV